MSVYGEGMGTQHRNEDLGFAHQPNLKGPCRRIVKAVRMIHLHPHTGGPTGDVSWAALGLMVPGREE